MVDIIICSVIISLCLTLPITALIVSRINRKHEDNYNMLKAKICALEERVGYVDDSHKWHMTKYH